MAEVRRCEERTRPGETEGETRRRRPPQETTPPHCIGLPGNLKPWLGAGRIPTAQVINSLLCQVVPGVPQHVDNHCFFPMTPSRYGVKPGMRNGMEPWNGV